MEVGEWEVSLCWHSAAVVLPHAVPCLLHLPFLSTSPDDLQQESPSETALPAPATPVGCVGRLPVPRVMLRAGLGPCLPVLRTEWTSGKEMVGTG